MESVVEKFTPPQLAKLWKKKPETIIDLIRSGALPAIDASLHPGVGRPRYLIGLDDIRAFEEARRVVPAPKQPPAKRRAPRQHEFFANDEAGPGGGDHAGRGSDRAPKWRSVNQNAGKQGRTTGPRATESVSPNDETCPIERAQNVRSMPRLPDPPARKELAS